ncbi:MAG: hypothetical protein ABIH00_07980 [Armatimonadota bacterium]
MSLLDYIEKNLTLKCFKPVEESPPPYYKELHITVIGAGVAGTIFARLIFDFAKKENIDIKVTVINNITCNYCAGLMTNAAYESLEYIAGYNLLDSVVLSKITDCVFINEKGSDIIPLENPLISVLRTNKFGIQGFDDYIKKEILDGYEELGGNFKMVEPAMVTDLDHIPEERKYNVYYTYKGMPSILKTDCVVFTGGLQKIKTKLADRVQAKFGYAPPKLMASSVTEIDLSLAEYNHMHNRVFIVDQIIPNTVIGLVSKREDWLTVSSLNKVLTIPDLTKLFNHPAVREYIYLKDVKSSLKCGIVCPTYVFTKEAHNFYGQGWVTIGDLTGMGRTLKDGYYHAVKQAYYAAWTIIYKGALKKSFDKYYYKKLKPQIFDNRIGMILFHVNNFLKGKPFFGRLFLKTLKNEEKKNKNQRYFTTAIKGLITGELSYKTIAFLFFMGLLKQFFRIDTYKKT